MSNTGNFLYTAYLKNLNDGVLTVDQANDGRLEVRQRESLMMGLAVSGALASATLDRDNDVPSIQAVQEQIRTGVIDITDSLSVVNSSINQLETSLDESQQLILDQLVLQLNQLTETNTRLQRLEDIATADALVLIELRDSVDSFRTNAVALLTQLNSTTDGISTDIDTLTNTLIPNLDASVQGVITATQNLFDYSTHIVTADTDARLIVREEWVNKTTKLKTILYYELDGITLTSDSDNAVADINPPIEVFFKDTEYTAFNGTGGSFILRRTYRLKLDGAAELLSSTWLNPFGVPLSFTPDTTQLALANSATNDLVSQNTLRFKKVSSSDTDELMESFTEMLGFSSTDWRRGLKEVTVTCIKLDDPDNPPALITPLEVPLNALDPVVTETTPFDVVGESVTFSVNDSNDLIVDGVLQLPVTDNVGDNMVKIIAVGRQNRITFVL